MDNIHKNQKINDYQKVLKACKFLQTWIVLDYIKELVSKEICDEKQMKKMLKCHINDLKTKLESYLTQFLIDNEKNLNRIDDLNSREWKFHQILSRIS